MARNKYMDLNPQSISEMDPKEVRKAYSASSSVEWHKITKKLAKKYTVYTIDLLGCGRSVQWPG